MTELGTIKPIIEALIFASNSSITLDRIATILEGEDRKVIKEALDELIKEYETSERGFTIVRVAGGYQLRTRPEYSPWIRRLLKTTTRISRASMECLAIIAYRQPITKGEVEDIRGVDSTGILRSLLEKRLIRIVGRKDAPGRPVLYGTTREFLETFDLKDLSHLPTLKDIQMMEEGDACGETPEGDSQGRGDIETEGRGDDSRGEGESERQGGNLPGGEGRS